ncbi:MAG: YbaB/EbfC family nucleoid-associated protein [Candidatus Doudnabacteria bacterium]|nr:YbaB/EbfC family nucleoid-associated protein [Candidatus Doudnabacteria bacterium]
MFDQLKDLYNLRKQADEMQRQLAQELVTGKSVDGTFTVTLNGNHELVEVNVSPDIDLNQPEIAKNIKQAFDDAQEQLKHLLSKKFQGMM